MLVLSKEASGESTDFHAMEFNSPRQQEIDFYFDPISESEIDDLVGSAVSGPSRSPLWNFRIGQTDPENHVQSAWRSS